MHKKATVNLDIFLNFLYYYIVKNNNRSKLSLAEHIGVKA